MHCIFWKFLVVSTENKFLFEDSFNVLFVRIIFLWFFMIFIMAYLWKGFSCGFYDFLHAIFVVMVFVVFCFNPLWFLWFLWFLWSLTFYSYPREVLYLAGGRQRACSSSGSCSQFLICLQSSSSSGTGVGAGQLTTTCHLNLPAGDSVAYCSACSDLCTFISMYHCPVGTSLPQSHAILLSLLTREGIV